MRARRFAVPFTALLFLATLLPAANLVVPSLELVTRGSFAGGAFTLSSVADLDLVVEGGYKFGGRIGLSYVDDSLEVPAATDRVAFDNASVIVRDLFGAPLSVAWFIGAFDVLASGSEFPVSFGTAEIATAYRGYLYFPDPAAPQYDGIHEVNGTGIRVSLMPVPDTLLLMAYVYQDGWFAPGRWSADLRVLANLPAIKIEGFAGLTSAGSAGWYRGGLLFHAGRKSVEVLAELGLPKWDPVADTPFSINLFSMLLEPRLHLGPFNVAATFFWHPGWYHQALTGELGTFDVNLNLYLGNAEKSLTQGGLEGNLGFDSGTGSFDLRVSPYLSFATPGAVWKLKVDTKLLPFDVTDLVEVFVGIRATF